MKPSCAGSYAHFLLASLGIWTALTTMVPAARAQSPLFGSETWRGHVGQLADQLVCRVFSHYSNGDRIALTAYPEAGSPERIMVMMAVSGAHLDTREVPTPQSLHSALARLARQGRSQPSVEGWVDEDRQIVIQGFAYNSIVSLPIGALNTTRAARFFGALREGRVLNLTLNGERRAYQLRGTFAALSELVGCTLRLRDGDLRPSDAMPPGTLTRVAPPAAPAPAASAPPSSPTPTPSSPVSARPSPPPAREREAGSGSGVVVTRQGYVLTNQHVISRCDRLTVRRVGDVEQAARLIAQDAQNDLAVLQADGSYPAAVTLRIEPPRMGESIIVFGFPLAGVLASSGNVVRGEVAALAGLRNDSRVIQISAPVQPGNSGGPVLDMGGLLVGIVQSKLDALEAALATGDIPQNVNFAIRGALAVGFLAAHGVEPQMERRRADLGTVDVSAIAQAAAVQVICYRAAQ